MVIVPGGDARSCRYLATADRPLAKAQRQEIAAAIA
jgi:hypothetical protein